MAATDKHYRDQYLLDMVFALSNLAMLGAVLWMFVQDYTGEWKTEQRIFYDVKAELAMRQALEQMPDPDEVAKANQEVAEAKKERENNRERIDQLRREASAIQPLKEKADAHYQSVKSYLESRTSFYNTAKENKNEELAVHYEKEIRDLEAQLTEAQNEKDKHTANLREKQNEVIEKEKPLNIAVMKQKALNDKFDTLVRVALKSQYGMGARFRAWPILDAFASPYKIHQVTNNDVPIDYNFKYVTRFDRCMTCHQGIDQPAFTRESLAALREDIPEELDKRLEKARKLLEKRRAALEGAPELEEQLRLTPHPDELEINPIPRDRLTDARVTEFCAHPRLDLFVGPNSKHPSEKFGCTACHSGQGSATSFVLASHTPNDSAQKKRWVKDYHWHYEQHHGNFLWDFPMLPKRFIESSCVKCHYQITDLITSDNRNEAPKLVRGHSLFKENGCFGCHDVAGRKAGRQVGPDVRLEPYPSRDEMAPAELVKLDEDPDKAPGTFRKVGPSLFRLVEKTNREFVAKWISAPREFRPDTKMPHFYRTSNNHPSVLPAEQKLFPDAEIYAITEYLFRASKEHLDQITASRKDEPKDSERRARLSKREREFAEKTEALTNEEKEERTEIRKQLEELAVRERLRKAPAPLDPNMKLPEGNAERGRFLFTVKGCLACHSHKGIESAAGKPGSDTFLPSVVSEAQFGPDLSQVAGKLGHKPGEPKSGRAWLVQWIKDPHVHSPRSRMPVTHMSDQEASDIAEWLVSQQPSRLGSDWNSSTFWGNKENKVPAPELQTLKDLTRVYLIRKLPADRIADIEAGRDIPKPMLDGLPLEEQVLIKGLLQDAEDLDKKDERTKDRLTQYVGKKAIRQLGCYGCHDIPGFEADKPIGTGLNDWGKKDPERLAFEDIKNFAKKHYYEVPQMVDRSGRAYPPRETDGVVKLPYEKFFLDSLVGHGREGYLHQKLLDPRSFDYERKRPWDDRARMPQFRFSRTRQRTGESSGDYEARMVKEEAEARESVMTFVLGLVAEPVPEKSISQPKGDRLAEIQGRSVLDKYNCGGCHVVRNGVVQFKLDSKTTQGLVNWFNITKQSWPEDHAFLYHKNWMGRPQSSPDRIDIRGVNIKVEEDEENPKTSPKVLKIRLTEALAFPGPAGGNLMIRANPEISLPVTGLVNPPRSVAENPEALQRFLRDQGQYGGAFTDVLTAFLVDRDRPKTEPFYKRDPNSGIAMEAASAAPPMLIGQGERTQGDWLYNFLLDPTQVRKMTEFNFGKDKAILRMPKFNMSAEEAKALVNYFAAVERQTNPGLGLQPFDAMPAAEEGLQSPLWVARNREYVERMKQTTKDPEGKPLKNALGKDTTFYHKRLEELRPVWEKIAQDVKDKQKEIEAQYQTAKKRLDAAADKDKDKAKSTDDTKRELQEADRVEKFLSAEVDRLKEQVARSTVEEQEAAWREREAYLADAFRIVLDKNQTCLKCHQIGSFQTNNQVQGPPLHLAHKRLRAGWLEQWIANPTRMVYYTPMPMNFPANKNNFPDFAGDSAEQVRAVRDILMAYPQASALPINRYWALPVAGEKKP